ncbi:MAG: hypothetical protein HQM08_04060 [Candidatus Riflebacteria bacterium]|nr:hypothetical protein [Candidatus Riflebacteria bacterium]
MIPLTTIQGKSPSELRKCISDRPVYIWGSGPLGQDVLTSLTKSGISAKGFLDSRPELHDTTTWGLPVFPTDKILRDCTMFILVSSSLFMRRALEYCHEFGRIRGLDYLTYLDIARPAAAVDVAGVCNMKCPECPHGNMSPLRPEGFISLDNYQKVLDKLLKEIPLLTNIELFTWGEPFLNQDLAEIVALTETKVPCTIATNLSLTDNLRKVIEANPSRFYVTISGFELEYEKNMPGASWDSLLGNLSHLRTVINETGASTKVSLQVYGSEMKEDWFRRFFIEKAKELNYGVSFNHSYVNPYENYLGYLSRLPVFSISSEARKKIEQQSWDVKKMIQLAEREKNSPCLSQRIFPIINWDLSVAQCHVYYGPVIGENFLTLPWEELLQRRHTSKQCVQCQAYSLHRLDLDLLMRKYPEEAKKCFRFQSKGCNNVDN